MQGKRLINLIRNNYYFIARKPFSQFPPNAIVMIFWSIRLLSKSQYIYQNSKLLAPVFCFAELVKTGSWAVWAEKHALLYTRFLPKPARKESNLSNVPKLKSDNLQYNTLVRWADGTNDSSTKRLTFQVFFFHNFLQTQGTQNSLFSFL